MRCEPGAEYDINVIQLAAFKQGLDGGVLTFGVKYLECYRYVLVLKLVKCHHHTLIELNHLFLQCCRGVIQ